MDEKTKGVKMNPQNYTINIRPGWGISPVVKVSQGDVGRPLAFTIMDGQDALTIASGTTVTIKGTKPSTLGFTQTCELSGNTASVETTATMTQEAGAVQAELILTQGTTVIGSANFIMYVEPAAHPEGTTDGDAETARDLMTRAQAAVEQAEAEADRAEEAAESASQTGISTAGATAGQVPTANGAGGWSWQDPQGGGGGTSDDIENKSTVSGATVTGALNSLNDQIANLSGGAPTQAQTVAQMVDTSKVYLYTGSEEGYIFGAWYHYDGTDWVYGGMYGEAASMSAGVKEALLACFRNVAWINVNGQTLYDNLYSELYPPVNLVSITAVYTQSGTVYDTDTLDSLKADLVVTAHYDDSTTETVTTYTLSGTLATGTSTITVAYGGKTTTFTVTVTHATAQYTITNTLTNCTNSNSATVINEETAYSGTLTADTDYVMGTVTITMGGTDITSTAYNSGTGAISIASVTGNIVITATATAPPITLNANYPITLTWKPDNNSYSTSEQLGASGTTYNVEIDVDSVGSDVVYIEMKATGSGGTTTWFVESNKLKAYAGQTGTLRVTATLDGNTAGASTIKLNSNKNGGSSNSIVISDIRIYEA
jgi:hypothetical protein